MSSFVSCSNEIDIGYISESSDILDENKDNYARNTLRVAYSNFRGCFNPFFAETSNDIDVVELTHLSLLTFDDKGEIIYNAIEGKTVIDNGEEYICQGIADISINENEYGNFICNIKLRNDIKFSDGELLDIDDLIFTMYVLCDPSYDGPSIFDTLPIKGLDDYTKNNAETISGIKRINDHSVDIELSYINSNIFQHLSIYIAPLHYYGDSALYDYQNDCFGFIKGDVSEIKAKKCANIGIGPYIYDSYENGVVKLHSNFDYFMGAPKIRYIELHKVGENKMLSGLIDEQYDICQPILKSSTIEYIKHMNGGELCGDVMHTVLSDYNGYTYIGINALNVKVGNYKDSYESKCLRKAFATIFSFYRQSICQEYYGSSATVINYPVSNISWMAPKASDEGYKIAFSETLNGAPIYTADMSDQEKYQAMLSAATEYFIAAGFVFDGNLGTFIMAPSGAKLEYNVMLPKDYSTLGIFEKSANTLADLGITLNITEVEDVNFLWNSLDNGMCEIWSAAWNTTVDHDLYQLYYSFNTDENKGSTGFNDFDIADLRLDDLIIQTKIETNRGILKSIYFECFNIILDWAIEVPVFQRSKAIVINSVTVNVDSYRSNSFYNHWYDDIQNLYLNQIPS